MKTEDMNQSLFFDKEGAVFMGAKRSAKKCNLGIYGVPYDGTTSFRPGARFGPSAIKEISYGLESYCPDLDLDLKELNYIDFGSLQIPYGAPEPVIAKVKEATEHLVSQNITPLMLGGEHSITLGVIESLVNHHKNLILVQLDAHADLREEWLGSRYSHACVIKRCLDFLPSSNIFQIAIRSGTRQEFKELKESKRLIPMTQGNPAETLKQVLKPYLQNPIYLTVDLDWFDPSVMPGTGTPEPGGYLWQDFVSIIQILKPYRLVGADIVELAPNLDLSNASSLLAAKATRTLLMLLSLSEGKST